MEKKKLIICDDEQAARIIIASSLQTVFLQHGVETEVTSCASVRELTELMAQTAFDLLVLDIDLPDINGITFGKQIRSSGNNIDIIYVSNREDRVFDSLKIDPVGFVRKSCLLSDIPDVVDRYVNACKDKRPQKKLVIEGREKIQTIPLKDIMYIEGSRNCQLIYLQGEGNPVPVRRNLQDLEQELDAYGFIRIHKGYLVNFNYIRLIEAESVLLLNGSRIPMSRRKAQETKDRFLTLMQSGGAILA